MKTSLKAKALDLSTLWILLVMLVFFGIFGNGSIPGAMTPTEVTLAHRSGADIVKLFPSGTLGAEYCKALRGPLPHIPCAAVGGVDAENLGQFYRAGIRCFGIGGSLVRPADVKAGRFETVTAGAAALRAALTQAEKEI